MVDNNSFETVSGETSAEFDHHEEDNILELVFAEEIYSSNFHYDLNFYLHNHPLCELNTDLYDVFKEFVNEEIETFIGISFYYSYGLAVLTFLDKNPNTCIEQFKKISESERIVCSSFAILYGLLLKRKGNSKIVESFIKSLRRELTEMENRIGWTGLSNGIQDEIGSQEKKIMNFHPVGLEWTLDEIESFDKEYFLNQYPIKSVSIKLIEHILRTADTIEEQKKAYKLIVKSLESIYNDGHCEKSVFYHLKNNLKVLSRPYTVGEDSVQKYEIRLPNMWWNEIDRRDFGNYLSLSATNYHSPLPKKVKIHLPKPIDTEKARKYFTKAIEKGYMKKRDDGGFKWLGSGKKPLTAELAYFCGKIYNYKYTIYGNAGENFPEEYLNQLFGVKRLYSSLSQVFNAQKKQSWRSKIDEMFGE